MQLRPSDSHDDALLAHMHPADWTNPAPGGRYNLVAIGGGTAGLVAAVGAAGFGAKVALVERRLLGGDCLNFGCVPSKALIASSRAAAATASLADFGFRGTISGQFDFAEVMDRVRRLRADISHHDSAERLAALGVDVFLGEARFTGPASVEVGGQRLDFRRAVIATGARPAEPQIEGLAELGFLTNETVFSLNTRPRSLVVVGAGPVGCELAQAFRRLGSEVHLVNDRPRILPKEDPDAAEVVRARLECEGVHLHLGWQPSAARRLGPSRSLVIEHGREKQVLIADEILVAIGRVPNTEGLDLAAAGVEHSPLGITVDDFLRSTNRRIYAAGDVCMGVRFTHAADAMARLVIQNALFLGRKRFSRLNVPRTTFTDPEIAHVGLTADEAERRHVPIDSYRVELGDVDRAVLDGQTHGFAVVHTRKGSGRIVGGTIVAAHAGEMIGELTLLVDARRSLGGLARTIHCYPTQAEMLRKIADAYERTRLTPRMAEVLRRWLAWRR